MTDRQKNTFYIIKNKLNIEYVIILTWPKVRRAFFADQSEPKADSLSKSPCS